MAGNGDANIAANPSLAAWLLFMSMLDRNFALSRCLDGRLCLPPSASAATQGPPGSGPQGPPPEGETALERVDGLLGPP